MKDRLQQFWNWGHNCRVLGLSAEETHDVLLDNRFTDDHMTQKETKAFMAGFSAPMHWTRHDLRFITLRPRLRLSMDTGDTESSVKKIQHSEETKDKIRASVRAFWESPAGRQKVREMRQERIGIYSLRKVHHVE